ncbi:MAG: hypothetical protein WGN25_01065 [Candidatus Electrothrix sp. GW3-4]|uniref:hypothetical protein n=1 Tax=Candidatus Electrothrix sp. GW3-4 TaxID=3126740 RepID=UPI0030CF2D11
MKNNHNASMANSGILEIAKKAIGNALLHHKAIGNEIVFWKDGKIVREKLTAETQTPKIPQS